MLTDLKLKKIKATGKRFSIADDRTTGLYARVSTTGAITFRARYTADGKRHWIDLGSYPALTIAEARAKAVEIRSTARNGVDPQAQRKAARQAEAAERASRLTVTDLIEEFVERRIKITRTPSSAPGILRQLHFDVSPVLGTRDIRTITKRDIADLISGMNDRRRELDLPEVKGTQRHIVQLLKQMFAYAVEREYLEHSPAAAIIARNIVPRRQPRERVLSDDEIRSIWDGTFAVTHTVRAALKVLLLTAQRRGSLNEARWEHVDPIKRLWTIPRENMKSGRPHRVHLSDGALEAFDELKALAGPSGWVLPGATSDTPVTERVITRAVARRGVDWTPHDLRRTAATRMNELGTPHRVVEKILDHVLLGVEAVYNHSELLGQQAAGLDLLWEHVHGIVSKVSK